MAVTKRMRFEILRRDGHACQYCGQLAPDVVLHIDHVMPVALGGTDKADNLLAACKDCNAGKTSIDPGSPLVTAIGDRAAAYALGMLDKMTRLRASFEEGDEYATQFEDEWEGYTEAGAKVPLPSDWDSTLHRWFRMGVPYRMVELAVGRAMALKFPRGEHGRFSYLCGIIWNQLDEGGVDYSLTQDTVHIYTHAEVDGELVPDAYKEGLEAGVEMMGRNAIWRDILANHIDGTTNRYIEDFRHVA